MPTLQSFRTRTNEGRENQLVELVHPLNAVVIAEVYFDVTVSNVWATTKLIPPVAKDVAGDSPIASGSAAPKAAIGPNAIADQAWDTDTFNASHRIGRRNLWTLARIRIHEEPESERALNEISRDG